MIFSFSLKKVLAISFVSVLLDGVPLILIANAPRSYAASVRVGDVAERFFCTLTRNCAMYNIGAQDPVSAFKDVFNISDEIGDVLNADLIKGKVLKHKATGIMHVADHFEDVPGKIYRDKRTGRYYSEHHLEEVPYKGIIHKHTGEIFVSNDFVESVANVFRHREHSNVLFSQHDYQDVLKNIIGTLEEQLVDVLSQ